MRHKTDSYQAPIAVLACFTALTSILVFFFPMDRSMPDSKATLPKRIATAE